MREPAEILRLFLQGSLGKARLDRYLGFAAKRKTHGKFLSELYHQFGDCVRSDAIVRTLPDTVLDAPALVFAPIGVFGEYHATFRDASIQYDSACLIVSSDSSYGQWCDETLVDAGILIRCVESG